MVIREFLCVHEHGIVIYHRKYQQFGDDSEDIVLRSGLISALYSFALKVEKDAIDALRMEKVTMLFKKREQLIFVLFLNSSVNPTWCERAIEALQRKFFERFPETLWQREIVQPARFTIFKEDTDNILLPLAKKLALILFLINEGLIAEEDYIERDFETLGSIVATKLMEKNHDLIDHAMTQGQGCVLTQVDRMLELLNGKQFERNSTAYFLECSNCYICSNNKQECFFEGFLVTILSTLGLILNIVVNDSRKNLISSAFNLE